MGLHAIMSSNHTSRLYKEHEVYRYLLRNLTVDRPNQVWAIDIAYIPIRKGFMYLVAIIDLHSRYVLNRSVLNSMEAHWCKEVVEEAIHLHGKPEIINTDQGAVSLPRDIYSQCNLRGYWIKYVR